MFTGRCWRAHDLCSYVTPSRHRYPQRRASPSQASQQPHRIFRRIRGADGLRGPASRIPLDHHRTHTLNFLEATPPLSTGRLGDEAGERCQGFKDDVLALVSYLWANGSTAQDQRNDRIGWTPPTWITQASFPYQHRYAHREHRFSWALRFI